MGGKKKRRRPELILVLFGRQSLDKTWTGQRAEPHVILMCLTSENIYKRLEKDLYLDVLGGFFFLTAGIIGGLSRMTGSLCWIHPLVNSQQ